MSATAGDAEFDDSAATAWTGLALAAKDIGKCEITSLFTFSIDVVFVSAAALFYR